MGISRRSRVQFPVRPDVIFFHHAGLCHPVRGNLPCFLFLLNFGPILPYVNGGEALINDIMKIQRINSKSARDDPLKPLTVSKSGRTSFVLSDWPL